MTDMYEQEAPSTGKYFARFILLCIPIVNVIMAMVWGFAGDEEETRNFGRAALFTILLIAGAAILLGLISLSIINRYIIEFSF